MIVASLLLVLAATAGALDHEGAADLHNEPRSGWHGAIGEGFAKGARSVEVKVTRALGTTDTGSSQTHNWWLGRLEGGMMLTGPLATNHWFGGNLEGYGQFMAGGQDKPEGAYYLGLGGGLRYHLRTGTRWDPFVGGCVGIAGTDAGEPDLGGKFQFNQQAGAGTRFFFDARHALTLEYNYWHVSNAGIRRPNRGLNAHAVSVGIAWMF